MASRRKYDSVGIVLRYDDERGYGFICPGTNRVDDIMFLRSVGGRHLQQGDLVAFASRQTEKGVMATRIKLLRPQLAEGV